MRTLKLKSLHITGFRSFRKAVNFRPSGDAGLHFLGGINDAEPELGANGAGKSSLWDALVWCLYGTSARGLKTSDLLTWGEKNCTVATVFLTGNANDFVVILRSGPPNRLYMSINDEDPQDLVEQTAVDNFIGLNRARFLQSVLFGQLVPLFIDLPIPARAELLDSVLDLSRWMQLSDAAAADETRKLADVQIQRTLIARLNGRIEELPDVTALATEEAAWENKQKASAEDAIKHLEALEKEDIANADAEKRLQAMVDIIGDLEPRKTDLRSIDQSLRTCEASIRQLLYEMKNCQDLAEFYRHTTVCDRCGQNVDKTFAEKEVKVCRDKYAKYLSEHKAHLNIKNEKETQQTDLSKKIQDLQDECNRHERARISITAERRVCARQIADFTQTAERLIAELDNNPVTKKIADTQARSAALTAEREAALVLSLDLAGEADVAGFWKAAFKRVRLFLIKRILATLEAEVNSAANVLGLKEWRLAFRTETLTKSETTKFGIQIEVTSPLATAPWEVWSGGESQRIRLAVAIGLSNMIQRMSGISVSFEVWDEPSAWLSPEGIEDLLECLTYRADATGKAVWIVDHRSLQYSSFAELWAVVKDADGSRIERVS